MKDVEFKSKCQNPNVKPARSVAFSEGGSSSKPKIQICVFLFEAFGLWIWFGICLLANACGIIGAGRRELWILDFDCLAGTISLTYSDLQTGSWKLEAGG